MGVEQKSQSLSCSDFLSSKFTPNSRIAQPLSLLESYFFRFIYLTFASIFLLSLNLQFISCSKVLPSVSSSSISKHHWKLLLSSVPFQNLRLGLTMRVRHFSVLGSASQTKFSFDYTLYLPWFGQSASRYLEGWNKFIGPQSQTHCRRRFGL